MKKAEYIFGFLAVVGICMSLNLTTGGNILTLFAISALFFMYLFFGFALLNGIGLRKAFKKESWTDISKKRKLGAAGAGIGMAVLLIGILYGILSWPGAKVMLLDGIIVLGVVAVVAIYKTISKPAKIYSKVLIRAAIIGSVGIFLFALPTDAILDFKYRDYPEYLEIRKQLRGNPHDMELRKLEEEEMIKMHEGRR